MPGLELASIADEEIAKAADRHAPAMARAIKKILAHLTKVYGRDVDTVLRTRYQRELGAGVDVFDEPVRKAAGDDLAEVWAQIMVDAADVAGTFGADFTLTNPRVIEIARQEAGRLVTNLDRQSREAINRVIVDATRGQLTSAQAARRIRQAAGLNVQQATALNNYTTALEEAVEEAKVPRRSLGSQTRRADGLRSQAFRPTPPARLLSDADVRRLSTTYQRRLISHRATVIARTECLPGDTPITGANPVGLFRRWFEGQMIEVECVSGRKISGTPNHPVLTTSGWRPLGQVTKGDRLLCDSVGVEQPGPAGDHHEENRPPTISEVFSAASEIAVVGRKGCRHDEFHGDGFQSNVDVLVPDGALRVGVLTQVTKSSLHGLLSVPDEHRVLVDCERPPFLHGRPVPPPVGFGDGTDLDAVVHQNRPNGAAFNAVLLGERLQGRPGGVLLRDGLDRQLVPTVVPRTSGLVLCGVASGPDHSPLVELASNRAGVAANLSGHPGDGQSGRVELDEVVDLSRRDFRGHVYNLSTSDGYFAANGVYTGNTMSAANRGIRAGWDEAVAEGLLDAGESFRVWVVAQDDRTCELCWPMDGQVVEYNAPFEQLEIGVEGQERRPVNPESKTESFSGDMPPRHPACRCTAILQFGPSPA